MRTDIVQRETEIRNWILNNESKAWICVQLKCKPETLDSYIKKFGIIYIGNRGAKGKKHSPIRKSALELCEMVSISSHKLKLRLFEDGIFERKCYGCAPVEWRGLPIPLELHHKDGNHNNNKVENLEILCPNCHAQCDNNSGKGMGRVA